MPYYTLKFGFTGNLPTQIRAVFMNIESTTSSSVLRSYAARASYHSTTKWEMELQQNSPLKFLNSLRQEEKPDLAGCMALR